MPEVATERSVSYAQVYALLRAGDLLGGQIGGRGVWRIERGELEAFITAAGSPRHRRAPPA